VSPIARIPLRSLRGASMIKPRVALIGDAAHVIHPLAGQGLNLGLQDAMALSHVLLSRGKPEGLGDILVLRRFERGRAEAIAAMHGVTDGLQRLFASESKFVTALRDAGLGLTDRLPGMKKLLIGHAIG
jgi:2-polyprenylphenol 6-hydroxylase